MRLRPWGRGMRSSWDILVGPALRVYCCGPAYHIGGDAVPHIAILYVLLDVVYQQGVAMWLRLQVYVAPAPFAPHCGWGHPALDAAMDQLDFWRELAALAYYWLRGWL